MPGTDENVVIDLVEDCDRDRMVRAAWAVLEANSWDGLRVEQVLAEVGLSTRSFYRQFANKSDLFAVMLERDIDALGDLLDASLASSTEPVDQVVTWISDLVHIAGTGQGLDHSRFFLSHFFKLSTEFPDFGRRCEDRIEVPLAAVIEDGARRGAFNSVDPRYDAHVVAGLAMECVAGQLMWNEPEVDSVRLEGGIRFALHGLCGQIEGDLAPQLSAGGLSLSER